MDKEQNTRRLLFRFYLKLGAAFLIFTLALGFLRVSGYSMYPTLSDGDLCMYFKLAPYHVGDIVVYTAEDVIHLGRIIARTGDVIDANERGLLLVNGVRPDEIIFYPTNMEDIALALPYTVGEGEYFLLHDFRSDRGDSRSHGCVSASALRGKLIFTLRTRDF